MGKMKVTFISTVFNEEKTIAMLLDSLLVQSRLPDEAIIVDAKSKDKTFQILKSYQAKFKKKGIRYEVFSKEGNRSVGRNSAIRIAKGEIIACSDAGNVLDKNWLKEIISSFKINVDIVAGFYKGIPKTVFEKSVVPYALVMEAPQGKLFFPSTRSMAIRKEVWRKVGEFPEQFPYSEDLFFNKKLLKEGFKFAFNKNAIAYWMPRENLSQFFKMIYNFACWDIVAGIIRPKALFIILRYLLGLSIIFLAIIKWSMPMLAIITTLFLVYLVWSVVKNYRYVNSYQAIFILPVLQISSDFAVIIGSTLGLTRWATRKTQ